MRHKKKHPIFGIDHILLACGLPLKVVSIAGLIFFGAFFLVNLGDLCLGWDFGTDFDAVICICFGILFALCLRGFGGIVLWRVEVDHEDITFRNLSGMTRHYTAADIARVDVYPHDRAISDKIVVRGMKHRLFTIDDNLQDGLRFVKWCEDRNVAVFRMDKNQKR